MARDNAATPNSWHEAYLASVNTIEKVRTCLHGISADQNRTAREREDASQASAEIAPLHGQLGVAFAACNGGDPGAALQQGVPEQLQTLMAQAEAACSQSQSAPLLAAAKALTQGWEALAAYTGSAAPASSSVLRRGAYAIWVADKDGQIIDPPSDPRKRDRNPDPSNPAATDIYFIVEDPSALPPEEQTALQGEIDKVLRILQRLYLHGPLFNHERFRIYYVRLFRIAQLGLEENALTTIAASALAVLVTDLIDDEAGRVKNGHLKALGAYALKYSLPFALLYLIIGLSPDGFFVQALRAMAGDPPLLAAFALLWIGCFTGVWLAYGIRKTSISLTDLVTTDEDRLEPQIRLIFAGLLTMLLGIVLSLGLIELTVGTISLTEFDRAPMLAFLLGAICGISELVLPVSMANRAASLFSGIK